MHKGRLVPRKGHSVARTAIIAPAINLTLDQRLR